jgi:endogenous inhibitor of DNA gyrase (YacG/DUF329 family)
VSIFGERRACPHCGRRVREPKQIEDYRCPRCGKPGPWATDEQAAAWQTEQDELEHARAAAEEATGRYKELLGQVTNGDVASIVPKMRVAADEAGVSDAERGQLSSECSATG